MIRDSSTEGDSSPRALIPLVLRATIGGVLMGLANLVPGISGGTMLLAAGVYPGFITAIAELSTLRFKLRSMVLLGTIVLAAMLAILLLAGTMRSLVIEQRWMMYSIFIGLTLGGLPLIWKLARPATPAVFVSAAVAFALMALMQISFGTGLGGEDSIFFLLLSGLAGASAMILPGVSGGYLLLLLGQYENILGSVDMLKRGLLNGLDLTLVMESMSVIIPVGIGVLIGVVGVSNLLKWLLERFEKATLGALLGLLLGAVVGLWPFQQPVQPELGSVVKGNIVTEANLGEIKQKDWPLDRFDPTGVQIATALGLVLAGLGTTLLVARIGRKEDEEG